MGCRYRNSSGYRRELTLTAKGVVVTETSGDPRLTKAIRQHAEEVSGFVRDGMPISELQRLPEGADPHRQGCRSHGDLRRSAADEGDPAARGRGKRIRARWDADIGTPAVTGGS